MTIGRRRLLAHAGAAGAAACTTSLPLPALAQRPIKLRAGYLHTLAVDGQIWLAEHLGTFADEGLEISWTQFDTGLGLFQAMVGGSLDILATGAVVSNFPARGQGKVFLINDVEFATAQLWVRPDSGIRTIAELKGKRIATTAGTTAEVFLYWALRANGLEPSQVQIINQSMSNAVTSFIAGAVPAVALWVPFNLPVMQKVPGAKMLTTAAAYYPQAAIVDGWAARNDVFDRHKEVLEKVIRGWLPANEMLVTKPDQALEILQAKYYSNIALPALKEMYKAEKLFPNAQWGKLYADGTVTKWLDNVTKFFVETGNISSPVWAGTYFDPKLFLGVTKA